MLPPLSRLEKLGIPFPFMVAPMVGISHVAFRELVRSYVPAGVKALRFTEMLSTRRLPSERLDNVFELKVAEKEQGVIVPQLLGNEELYIKKSMDKLDPIAPWGFDINMGCPVSHTLRHNWGVRLMGDTDYAVRVVEGARRSTTRPLSVKLRGGAGDEIDGEYLLRFTQALENAGADWLTIHPRPRSQGHKGRAHWECLTAVARARRIPVVANGDIQTADDALSMLKTYGLDGAMIARAATARPWILWQIAAKLGCDAAPEGRRSEDLPVTLEQESREYFRALNLFINLLREYATSEEYAIKKLRFFIITGSKWFTFGHSFWKGTMKGKTLSEVQDIVAAYSEKHEFPMYERVDFL